MKLGDISNGAGVTTTDATPTTLLSYALPTGLAAVYLAMVTARNTTTNKSANTVIAFGAQNLAGTAAILGTPTNVLTVANGSDAAMNTVSVAITNSTGNVVVQGTGIAATNILWTVSLVQVKN